MKVQHLKFRVVALLTFAVGIAASWFFQTPADVLARFQISLPGFPKPITKDTVPNCGMLVVTIDNRLDIRLNSEDMGTVDDTKELKARLMQIFQQRKDNRAYNPGMEYRTDLPIEERIMKIVFIKASRSLRYGEVIKLVDDIKEAGANPIGLQIDDLPS